MNWRAWRTIFTSPACTRCGTELLLAVHAGVWECLRCGLLKAVRGGE